MGVQRQRSTMPTGFDKDWKPPILEETHEYDHWDHLFNQHGEIWGAERTRLSNGVRPASKRSQPHLQLAITLSILFICRLPFLLLRPSQESAGVL